MSDILKRLSDVLESRKTAKPESSYVASLYTAGENAVLQKVGEEAVETLLACKSGKKKQMVHETADLWFHTLVMLAYYDLEAADVLAELERRFGVSGHEEKNAR